MRSTRNIGIALAMVLGLGAAACSDAEDDVSGTPPAATEDSAAPATGMSAPADPAMETEPATPPAP
jgi:hypothetical protein